MAANFIEQDELQEENFEQIDQPAEQPQETLQPQEPPAEEPKQEVIPEKYKGKSMDDKHKKYMRFVV
jgi:hypothetical protein